MRHAIEGRRFRPTGHGAIDKARGREQFVAGVGIGTGAGRRSMRHARMKGRR